MSGREVIARRQLVEPLQSLGVERAGVLVVHASFRAVGPVEGGPSGLIDGLREVLGPTGTLVMPSMTGSRRLEPYDAGRTPTRAMGIVAETFWRLPETYRGDHPTSAFAASGPLSRQITASQPLSPAHGLDSPIGRVYQLGGSILLLGVGHDSNTTIHLAERMAQVPYLVPKWTTVLRNGLPERVEFDAIDHCCRNFRLVDEWLRERGLQIEGEVGHASARLMESRSVIDAVTPQLRGDPLRFLCSPVTPCEECDAARKAAWAPKPAGESIFEAPRSEG